MIDPERQWFKARCGPLAPWTDRGPALCTAVFESEAPMTVADASLDPRFAGSPFVAGEPHISTAVLGHYDDRSLPGCMRR